VAEVDSAETSQWFLVFAAMLALGLVIASACIATRALLAQREERAANDLARAQVDEARRSLLATAKELRVPLARIADDVRLLESASRSEHDREVLESIAKNVQRVDMKLRDLLDVAALESGTIALHKEPCNVSVLVNDAIRRARPTALEQGIRLRFQTPVGFTVHADRSRIGTVMSSLLDLQIASASAGALITIETTDTTDGVEFTFAADYVADAIGTTFRKRFPLPDDMRVIMAERMIEAHGGELEIDHTPVGVAIRFTIPTAQLAA
jgi:signal transduction histidine kinase